MKFKDIITTASGNLFRAKVRTLLTILAIFIGAFTLTLTSGLGAGVSTYLDSQIGNLGQKDLLIISAKTDKSPLDNGPAEYKEGEVLAQSAQSRNGIKAILPKDIEKLKSFKELSNVKPFVIVKTAYIRTDNSKKYTLTTNDVPADSQLDLIAGKQLANDKSMSLAIPKSYTSVFGFNNEQDLIGLKVYVAVSDSAGKIYETPATVKAVLEDGLIGEGGAVLTPSLIENLHANQIKSLPTIAKNAYVAATANMKNTDEKSVKDLKSKLSKAGYSGTTIEDQLGVVQTVINAITWVLNSFALIALLAAGFGIVNTLFMSVTERTKEIGLMKAMGMPKKRIFALFSIEAVLIGFWGSVLGAVSAMSLGLTLNSILGNGILKNLPGLNLFSFQWSNFIFTMVLIMGIAFLAGALPARRAAKLSPIDALRYE